jgi:signal transduction histidine kinase
MRGPLFLFLLSFLSISSIAQKRGQARIDSLLTALPVTYADSSKTKILIDVSLSYAEINPNEGIRYGGQAIDLAEKTGFIRGKVEANNAMGLNYKVKADYKTAIDFHTKAFALAKTLPDKKNMATSLGAMGSCYLLQGAYPKSLEYYLRALRMNEEIGSKPGMASIIGNIGNVYSYLKDYDKSLEYYERALHLQEELHNKTAIAANLGNAGYIYLYQNNFDKALQYINRSLQINEEVGANNAIIGNAQGLGRIYQSRHNYLKAVESFEKSLAIAEKLGNKISIAQNLVTISEVYLAAAKDSMASPFANELSTKKGLLAKALININRAVAIRTEVRDMNGLNFAYDTKSDIELAAGDAVASLLSYKEHIRFRDSVFNADKTKEINRRELQYEFGKREDSITYQQMLTAIKLNQQELVSQKQEQQLLLVSKEKDLQRLSYLQKQAQLQREKELQESLLEKNKLQARLAQDVSDKQIQQQQLQISFDKKVKSYLALAVVLVILIAFLIYYNQRKTKKLNQIIVKQKGELEELGQVKDRIFSVVSHDMRTPVNTLISFIDILEDDEIGADKLHAYAAELKNQLSHTSVLMENLLNWASSQMKGFTPMIENTETKIIIEETISILQQQAGYKNILITNDNVSGIYAAADKNMLALIIRNIISNAIKFTPENGKIDITSSVKNREVWISITDNGTGMPIDKVNSFNDPLYLHSIDSKRGTKGETGTGLGLMLCKTFTALMKVRISAESSEGKGTKFTVVLPEGS